MEEENEENYTKATEGEFGISVRRNFSSIVGRFWFAIFKNDKQKYI